MTRIAFNAPAMLARILALRHANTHLAKPIGNGAISRCGDGMLRTILYQAALALLTRTQRWSGLKAWGVRVAKRRGLRQMEANFDGPARRRPHDRLAIQRIRRKGGTTSCEDEVGVTALQPLCLQHAPNR
jgi:hypothetical protein